MGIETIGRRPVVVAPTTGLALNRIHGSVLVRDDSNFMYDPRFQQFNQLFYHSIGWIFYFIVLAFLILFVVLQIWAVLGRYFQLEVDEQLEDMFLQYDYLWNMRMEGMHAVRHQIVQHHFEKKHGGNALGYEDTSVK